MSVDRPELAKCFDADQLRGYSPIRNFTAEERRAIAAALRSQGENNGPMTDKELRGRLDDAEASSGVEPVAWRDEVYGVASFVDELIGEDCDDSCRAFVRKTILKLLASSPPSASQALCSDCPPVGYPTDETRCTPCPRRSPPANEDVRSAVAKLREIADFNQDNRFGRLALEAMADIGIALSREEKR